MLASSAQGIVWVFVNSYFGLFLSGVCYHPPGASPGFDNLLRDDLSMLALQHTGKPIFLFGHFNLPGIDRKASAPT